MELVLFLIIFAVINLAFLRYTSKNVVNAKQYDTIFCRNVRVQEDRCFSSYHLEEKRKRLNSSLSKF